MKSRLLGLLALLGLAGTAHAAIYTEEYTGAQDVNEGQTYTFDFDMWNINGGIVNDNSSLSLTKDAFGATGTWLSAQLYIDFWSEDWDNDYANINFQAWTNRSNSPGTSTILNLSNVNVSGNIFDSTYNYSANLGGLNTLDNYGWGSLRIGATSKSGLENDLRILKVGLRVTTSSPTAVAEPTSLALMGLGLFGLGIVTRRRRAK